jgi:metal-responsive CopG/Arc/MetJ family transcriptional regulator
MPRTQTLVALTDDLLTRLDERAAREQRSRSTLITEAIEDYLRDELQTEVDRRIVEATGVIRVCHQPRQPQHLSARTADGADHALARSADAGGLPRPRRPPWWSRSGVR